MNFLKTAEGKNFIEHHDWYYNASIPEVELPEIPDPILFQKRKESICVQINKEDRILHTSYFVGTDWLNSEKAIYIEPKLNKDSDSQTNYLQMLFSILRHPDRVD
jgi:5-methylcytosine-specific restriction enzyme subunit McrC